MCVRVSSTVRPCSAKMSATSWRWIFQMTKRSGSTVSIPSGPGGSASDADTIAALRAASRAIRSADCAASGVASTREVRHVRDDALDEARRIRRRRRKRLREDAFGSSSVRLADAWNATLRRQREIIPQAPALSTRTRRSEGRYNARSGSHRRMATGSHASMRIFGFAGWSGSGKTTLIEQIIPRLVQRGLTVSLVKHAHHRTEFDQPGKDSYRLRHAGCSEVLVTSGARWALMHELRANRSSRSRRHCERLSPCDLVLIEGYKAYPIPKLEIWRAEVGKPLLHPRDPRILAIATDSPTALPPGTVDRFPVFSLVRC